MNYNWPDRCSRICKDALFQWSALISFLEDGTNAWRVNIQVTVGCLWFPHTLTFLLNFKNKDISHLVQCVFALVIFEPANKWPCDFYRHHIAPTGGFLSGNGGGSLGLCSSSYQIYSSCSGILLTDIFWIRHLPKCLESHLLHRCFSGASQFLRLEMLWVTIVHIYRRLPNQNSMQPHLFCPNFPHHVG